MSTRRNHLSLVNCVIAVLFYIYTLHNYWHPYNYLNLYILQSVHSMFFKLVRHLRALLLFVFIAIVFRKKLLDCYSQIKAVVSIRLFIATQNFNGIHSNW